jgi:hypothetical protein
MAFVACDENGSEWIYEHEPKKLTSVWNNGGQHVELPSGTIKKLIGRDLSWDDDPVELT